MEIASIVTQSTSILPGQILGFGEEGSIHVLPMNSEEPVMAFYVRTSAAPLPSLGVGDIVLLMLSTDSQCYVLGLIEPYAQPAEDTVSRERVEPEAGGPGALSQDVEKVQLIGKKVYIEAEDEIRLKCGEGLVVIDKQGKVVTRGTKVLSRAKGVNKIKGGSVSIN